MRKLTAILVASGLALGAANLAHAADTSAPAMDNGQQMMKHHRGHPGGPGDMMMFHGLNLTDAQKQQFRDIMKAQHENMKRPSVEERRAMHDIIASDTFDSAKAQAQIDKISEQSKQRMLARMEAQNKMYNILTPEQKKQFNANFEKHLTEKAPTEGKMPPDAQ